MIYTDEMRDELKTLFADGISAGRAAEIMTAKFGVIVTRNAVIGRWHRAGLRRGRVQRSASARNADRALEMRLQRKRVPPAVSAVRHIWGAYAAGGTPEPAPKAENPADYPSLVAFADLEDHHCRWPVGDPKRGPFGFCGAGKVEGLPYCLTHVERAYQPPARQRPLKDRTIATAAAARRHDREEVQ